MTAAQRDQLIHKAPCGMRHFVNEALMSASKRLKVLLYTEDPSLEVEKTFPMKGIQHFKFNLKIQKAAAKEKLRSRVVFSDENTEVKQLESDMAALGRCRRRKAVCS